MILAVQQDEYFNSDVAGIRIVISPQGEMPLPDDSGITVAPGQIMSIGIVQVNYNNV